MKFEYKDFEEMHLMDKIQTFGWLSDLLTKEDAEITIQMHENKIKRIKNWIKTQKN